MKSLSSDVKIGDLRETFAGYLCLVTGFSVHFANKKEIGRTVNMIWADNLEASRCSYENASSYQLISQGKENDK